MDRSIKTGGAQPLHPLTIRQRIFVVALLLFALALSFVIVCVVDPNLSATTHSSALAPHLIVGGEMATV
jgi:hypothetical protein